MIRRNKDRSLGQLVGEKVKRRKNSHQRFHLLKKTSFLNLCQEQNAQFQNPKDSHKKYQITSKLERGHRNLLEAFFLGIADIKKQSRRILIDSVTERSGRKNFCFLFQLEQK